jgi:alpha-beta hydrolase superfamily lysophospholipase
LLARFFPTLPVPLKIDLGQLTHDQNVLERHQADLESGLRGTMATPRFAKVSERAQHKLAAELSSWKDFPLAIAIAGADDLADAEFTQTQVQGMQSPVVQYRCYQDNLHENFNELNRQHVFQYLFDSLNM